jgi:transposase InsO family protein
MLKVMLDSLKRLASSIVLRLKQWSRPATVSLLVGVCFDLSRSRKDLIVENALLRQQLIVLNRQVKRPELTQGDRLHLVLLARLTRYWQAAQHIVQPGTLLRWQRERFCRYWRRKTRSKKARLRMAPETIALIKQMACENLTWGAERLRGELLKLGIKISKRTVQKYLPKDRKGQAEQTWATFLKRHLRDSWACDFTVAHDLLFRPLHIFVIMELHTRRIVYAAVTRNPTDGWTAQQLRQATPWGKRPKYLIRDRDSKYGRRFAAASSGIEILKTPVRTPKANAYCERFMGSLRRECLDHTLIVHRRQLQRAVHEYIDYYNCSRPHQGLGQRIPERLAKGSPWPVGQAGGRIVSTPVLGGLHHSYTRIPDRSS